MTTAAPKPKSSRTLLPPVADAQPADAPKPTPEVYAHRLHWPAGMPRTDDRVRAYLRGAIDYATGLGLDRLAKDLGVARAATESDHDLSRRLAGLLGVR